MCHDGGTPALCAHLFHLSVTSVLRWQGRHDHLYFINKNPKAWRDCPAQDRKGGGAQSVQSPVSHITGLRTLTVFPQFVKRALWWPERRHDSILSSKVLGLNPSSLFSSLIRDPESAHSTGSCVHGSFIQDKLLAKPELKAKTCDYSKNRCKRTQRWMRTTQSPNLGVSLSSGRTTNNCL